MSTEDLPQYFADFIPDSFYGNELFLENGDEFDSFENENNNKTISESSSDSEESEVGTTTVERKIK